MIPAKSLRILLFVLLCAVVVVSARGTVAQTTGQPRAATESARDDDTNLDTQLYLVLATNRDVEEVKTPMALEHAMKQLRESLNFKHFNLVATFLNRVKNNSQLDVSWVGGPFLLTTSSAIGNPSFNQFGAMVRLATNNSGNEVVRMTQFRFGARVPIVTAQSNPTTASTGAASFPVINYESVGLHTDISMREGEPVIAGTLNVGPSGDAIIVVIAARRSPY